MFCPSCGKQIPDHSGFCLACGNAINSGPAPIGGTNPQLAPTNLLFRRVMIVVAIVLALCVALRAVAFVMTRLGNARNAAKQVAELAGRKATFADAALAAQQQAAAKLAITDPDGAAASACVNASTLCALGITDANSNFTSSAWLWLVGGAALIAAVIRMMARRRSLHGRAP